MKNFNIIDQYIPIKFIGYLFSPTSFHLILLLITMRPQSVSAINKHKSNPQLLAKSAERWRNDHKDYLDETTV